LRREQFKLQVALLNPLGHLKGFAAPETKAAVERARLLIEQAEALGGSPEDPLLLFSVLYGFWAANFVAFNGDALRELAAQFLALAVKQEARVPLMIGYRLMGSSLMLTGDITGGRAHYDQALALYDPPEDRPLATRFGQDIGVSILSFRSWALWTLGYPEAALADTNHALTDAREIGHVTTLMYTLTAASIANMCPKNYAAANILLDELDALANQKGASFWKAFGTLLRGSLLASSGSASEAVNAITSGLAAYRLTGANNDNAPVAIVFSEGLCRSWSI
jgi:hypothetical protein